MSDPAPAHESRPLSNGETAWTLPSLAGRPTRLSMAVVDALVDRIVSGGYPSGTLLPPEPVLCQHFGMSRSVVREALKVLEEKGLVSVHQGHGTLVADPEDWNLLDPMVLAAVVRHDERHEVIDDLIALRTALEAGMAARAAVSRTEEDLIRLRALLRAPESALYDVARYLALDVQFHDELMQISGNRLARAVVDAIHRQARSSAAYSYATIEDLRLTHSGHVSLLQQLEAGNPEGAAAAMREHIISMWSRKRERSSSLDRPLTH